MLIVSLTLFHVLITAFLKFSFVFQSDISPATNPTTAVAINTNGFKFKAILSAFTIPTPLFITLNKLENVPTIPAINENVLNAINPVTIAVTVDTISLPCVLTQFKKSVILLKVSSGIDSFIISLTATPIPLIVVFTTGNKFLATVFTLSVKFFTKSSVFTFSLAIPVNKLLQALFIEFIEPSIVVLASKAVVPVIPMLSCTL